MPKEAFSRAGTETCMLHGSSVSLRAVHDSEHAIRATPGKELSHTHKYLRPFPRWLVHFLPGVMSTYPPLRKQRLIALALTAAWCIISGSIGLNSLIKFVSHGPFVHRLQTNFDRNIGRIRLKRGSGRRHPQVSRLHFISMVALYFLHCLVHT